MKVEEYIFPIFSDGIIVGQGFIADGFFITAAHLLKKYPSCYIIIQKERLELANADLINYYDDCDYLHNPEIEDAVMFSVDNTSSPLHLSGYIPRIGDFLDSYCLAKVVSTKLPNPIFELSIIPAFPVINDGNNYFYCDCKQSDECYGSPLLKGNEVIGILHCRKEKEKYSFLKMGYILFTIGEYYYNTTFDPLENSKLFHAIPQPDYACAFRWYMKAADNGYLEAFYKIAKCYERGKGVRNNTEEAIRWYTKGANLGHIESQFLLGYYYLKGIIVSQSYSHAINWLQLAAEKEHKMSMFLLGLCSYMGWGVQKSYRNAIEWFKLADKCDHRYSFDIHILCNTKYYLGLCYLNDKSIPLNQYLAVSYFQEAGEVNEALYYLGLCHFKGWGVSVDYNKAFNYYKKASDTYGEFTNKAYYEVGMCYYNGMGANKNYEESIRWFEKAYDCNEALFQLGICYYKGHGVEADHEEALKYFNKAAIYGNIEAQKYAGGLYREIGEEYKQKWRIEKAININLKLYYEGYTEVLYSIGNCFETLGKIGFDDEYENAIEWYKKAWEHGDLDVILFIDNCYHELFELGKNKYYEAIDWYKQAWNQCRIDALWYIGNCYETMFINGVIDNMDESIMWYKKAAAFKYYKAFKSLSHIYQDGIGVLKNANESKKWEKLAEKNDPWQLIKKEQNNLEKHNAC